AVLFAGTVASFSSADAAGGCGAGFHRGPGGGCVANRGAVVVAPGAPVVVDRPVVAAPRVCPAGSVWRAGALARSDGIFNARSLAWGIDPLADQSKAASEALSVW